MIPYGILQMLIQQITREVYNWMRWYHPFNYLLRTFSSRQRPFQCSKCQIRIFHHFNNRKKLFMFKLVTKLKIFNKWGCIENLFWNVKKICLRNCIILLIFYWLISRFHKKKYFHHFRRPPIKSCEKSHF